MPKTSLDRIFGFFFKNFFTLSDRFCLSDFLIQQVLYAWLVKLDSAFQKMQFITVNSWLNKGRGGGGGNYFLTQGQIDLNYFFLLINQHLTTASVAIYSGYHKKKWEICKKHKSKKSGRSKYIFMAIRLHRHGWKNLLIISKLKAAIINFLTTW